MNLVSARARLDHLFGQPDHRLVEEVVRRALRQLALYRGDDLRVSVAEQRRSRAQVVVDEVSSGDVGDVAAVAFGDHQVDFVRQDEQAQPATSEITTGAVEKIGLGLNEDGWVWHA